MAEKMSRRRVKLYALNSERQWDDRGTGHVTATFVDRLKGISLLVRAEADGAPLLESKIQTDTAYQKQQGTLIVWSEGDNFDLALSFQEKAGCDEIWEKICQVQGKDPSVEITQEVHEESEEERFEEANDSNVYVELPPCEMGKLEQISELLSASLQNVNRQDKIANSIENECYIKKLIDLFRLCEDVENFECLHILYEIFKNIFLLNKNSLLEVLFSDENIFDVIGALEYDPSSPTPKKHRDFLKSMTTFKEVIPIENSELLNKIHQTFRVQYIQDVALPNQTVFEENLPSTLTSFIFFNKVEIVSLIQDDERFLSELFLQLSSEDVPVQKRRDLILFLKEFCTFSQTLQPPSRESFYKTLNTFGVLGALECTLAIDDAVVKAASVDVLGFFVEFSPSMVRDYMIQQQHKLDEEHYLLNIMVEQMVVDCDPEMGGAVQLMGILRILIDPENMLATNNKAERVDFLTFFYKHSIHYLIAPLLSNTVGDVVVREDYQTAQLAALILELLSFCVEHHSFHIKNYLIHRELLRRVMVLVKSKHTFLVLCAVRFIRKIVGMKDEFYNRHIIANNIFAPLVDAYIRNDARYNLLDSAILELFEFIKSEDIKSLLSYSMEKFGDVFSRIEYVQTFSIMRARYIEHQDKIRDREKSTAAVESLGLVRSTGAASARYRRDLRDMDAEEEQWFSSDDCDEDYHSSLKQELLKGGAGSVPGLDEEEEDDEPVGALLGATSPHRLASSPLLQAQVEKLQKENPALTAALESSSSSHVVAAAAVAAGEGERSSSAAGGEHHEAVGSAGGISLVDYDENSDEEEEEMEDDDSDNSNSSTGSSSSNPSSSGSHNNSGVNSTETSLTETFSNTPTQELLSAQKVLTTEVSKKVKENIPISDGTLESSSSAADDSKSSADAKSAVANCSSPKVSITASGTTSPLRVSSENSEDDIPGNDEPKEKLVSNTPRKVDGVKDAPGENTSDISDDTVSMSKANDCSPSNVKNKSNGGKSSDTESDNQEGKAEAESEISSDEPREDMEQEKKRDRLQQDENNDTKTKPTNDSKHANSDGTIYEKHEKIVSSVANDVTAAANGLSKSDDLLEGETLRKRPRLAVD